MGVDHHERIFQLFRKTTEYKTCRDKFKRVRWVSFLEKFHGYNDRVAKEFAETYDGMMARLGEIEIQVTKSIIVEATDLLMEGEKYFKGMSINKLCQ